MADDKLAKWLYDFLEEQGVHVKDEYLTDSAREIRALLARDAEPVAWTIEDATPESDHLHLYDVRHEKGWRVGPMLYVTAEQCLHDLTTPPSREREARNRESLAIVREAILFFQGQVDDGVFGLHSWVEALATDHTRRGLAELDAILATEDGKNNETD